MTRRSVAGLLAFVMIGVLMVVAAREPVPWVTFRPGPTLNVLGEYDGKQIIKVTGRKTYTDKGALRMVTVYPSGPDDKLDLFTVLFSWVSRDDAVLPREAVYKESETNETVRQESAAQMTSSQDASTSAALTALDIEFRTEIAVPIIDVAAGGAAAGKLKVGDLLVAVAGKTATTTSGFIDLVRSAEPGAPLPLTVLRAGSRKKVSVTTRADETNPRQSRIGAGLSSSPEIKLVLPFDVDYRLSDNIGGPSAGMIFALALYDLLTPGSLTGGEMIAGSGEITPEGVVGPIGGISQKLVSAQRDGAKLFLVAQENCAEALGAHYDPDTLRLVKIHTLEDAIQAVEAWRKNPAADLPRCTR